MFKLYDYVYFSDKQMDGILTEYNGNGDWVVEMDWGSGGGSLIVNESEMIKSEYVPKHYVETIKWLRESCIHIV